MRSTSIESIIASTFFNALPKRSIFQLVVLVAAASSTLANACEFSISRVSASATLRYDVFNGTSVSSPATIEIERTDVAPVPASSDESAVVIAEQTVDCDARVLITGEKGSTLSSAGFNLSYRLTSDATASNSLLPHVLSRQIGGMEPGEVARWRYTLEIPAGQFVPSGQYNSVLEVSVGPNASGTKQLLHVDDTKVVQLRATVASSARIVFSGVQGRSRQVDFGSLTTGAVPIFEPAVIVQSTSPYRLRFRSDNNGKLISEQKSNSSKIPYELIVAGKLVNLSSSRSDLLFNTKYENSNRRIPFEFKIVNAEKKRAGSYSDRVIVDIVPFMQ